MRFGGSGAFAPRSSGYGGGYSGAGFYSGPPAPDYGSGNSQSWW